MRIEHTVAPHEAGITLQQLLREQLGLSARQAKIAKQQGAVLVDDAPFFSNQPLRAGMVVRVELSQYDEMKNAPESDAPPVEVLYEDDAIIAVYKPALLQCHPSPSAPGGSDTLEARVTAYLGAPAHPVHRLDAETTGIVLFAKVPYAQAKLQRQMQQRQFQKAYQAWVYGEPFPPGGIVDAPIGLSAPDSFTRIVREDGQSAMSIYNCVKTIDLPGGGKASLVDLSPMTGRTHQLRVHMAYIGCPLLGDVRYGTEQSVATSNALGLSHHQLAAVALKFTHPTTGKTVALRCPARFDFDPDKL